MIKTTQKKGAATALSKADGADNDKQTGAKKQGLLSRYPVRIAAPVAMTLFTLFVFVLLVTCYGDYLRKLSELNYFVGGGEYFSECMRTPGGLIVWVSTFLTTLFAVPAVGAAVFALTTSAMATAAAKAVRLPDSLAPAMVLPFGAALLAMVNLGYAIFSLKSPGTVYVPVIGAYISVVAYHLYRMLPKWYFKAIALALWMCLGYAPFGFFAILACVFAVVGDMAEMIARRRWLLIMPVAVAVVMALTVPGFYFTHFANDLTAGRSMLTPLPRFLTDEAGMWTVYKVMFAALAVMVVVGALCGVKAAKSAYAIVAGVVVYAGTVVWVCVDRYSDSNFDMTLALDRLANDDNLTPAEKADKLQRMWQHVDAEPTRLNIVLTQALMLQTSQAPDMIFRLPFADGMYTVSPTRGVRLLHEAGAPVALYNMGLNRYAYRMAMENLVEYGKSVGMLKLLAKNALVTGDYGGARKYISTLSRVPMQGEWARKYMAYIDNPDLIAADAEMKPLLPLQQYPNSFIRDNGRFETYVWPVLQRAMSDSTVVTAGGDAALDRAMVSALMNQHLEGFIRLAEKYMESHDKLPLHYQEGVLAWSLANKNSDYANYPIDESVMARYRMFVTTLESSGKMSEEQLLSALLRDFGDTYWFYFMYKDKLDII